MPNIVMPMTALIILLFAGCERHFSFDVVNQSGGPVENVDLDFSGDGGNWPVGSVNGSKSVGLIHSAVPDSVDISWFDGVVRKQHIQITPLPDDIEDSPPGSNDPNLYFIIGPNGTAHVAYHNPRLTR
jgi:hypothetical protein